MDTATQVWLLVAQFATLAAMLAIVHVPLGNYMARVFSSPKDLKVERGFYRVIGVDSASEQSWPAYLRSVLAFSAIGILLVYGLQRLQEFLPWSLGLAAPGEALSFNTAISFVTNTNWQSYSPDITLGYSVQLIGLAVQNFVSAAVGIAVAIALVRGFARRRTGTIGNFWVDLTRGTLRILLPFAFIAAIVLIAGGAIQNFAGFQEVSTITGGTATVPGGPVASQEAIKELGTNGGGFYNVNSAHPFENPTAWTNLIEIFLLLVIPFSLTRTFGKLVGDTRQGFAILATMSVFFIASLTLISIFEFGGNGTAPQLAGGAMEGKETRYGIGGSILFAHRNHAHLHGCRELDARQLHGARRHDADAQHDARRDRSGRRRSGPLRHPRRRDPRGVHRRPPGRAARPSTSARRSGRARSSSRACTSSRRRRSCCSASG